MMELTTCAFVITVVSLVTATPHGYGYGVKGSAGATAVASSIAVAGAFGNRGDLPAGIVMGNGFSGSFSKSSSSSASSSSASSSSSSFSYSGSGAGGFSGYGSNVNIVCTNGVCQSPGANEIPANHGLNSAVNGYNAVNAAAIAGPAATPGGNCQGSACDNNGEKCSSGQCQPKSQTGIPLSSYDVKCTSGQCDSTSPTGPSPASYDDSDDIRFVPHSSKSAHDSNDHSSSYDKTRGYNTGSSCLGGNCESSSTFSSQPSYSQGSTNSYQNSKPLTNLNSASTPSYHVPAINLETPKQDSDCSSGNCNGISPSEYNNPTQKPTCYDGKCQNQQKGSYSSTTSNALSTNYLSPQGSQLGKLPSYGNPSSTDCLGSNCGLAPSTNNPPGAASPTCTSPNCYPYHSKSSPPGPYTQPGLINPVGSVHKVKPLDDKLPVYTGGFGAPAGVFKPNEYEIPVTGTNSPSHVHPSTPILSQPTFGTKPTGCKSPNCYGQASTPGVNGQPTSFGSHTPSVDISGSELPTYTGGFGGPAGMLKPSEFNIPAPVTSTPVHSAGTAYNTPSSPVTSCNTPNCNPSSVAATSSASAQAGSYGIHKQQSGSVTVTSDKLPTYTGGFGGPAGMLKPNEFDIQVIIKPTQPTNPSFNSQSPTSLQTAGCKTPNCNTYASASGATANAQSGSYGAAKPNTGIDSSSELPPYTGGFGGPVGLLKPNEFNVPQNTPNIQNPSYSEISPSKSPVSNNLPGCTTPNCSPSNVGTTIGTYPQAPIDVTKPSSIPHQSTVATPGYTNNYNRPIGVTYPSAPAVAPISPGYGPTGVDSIGCKTGNCASNPTDVNTPTGSFGITNPNSNVKPEHTGGYGGPSSTPTPTDNSYNVPSTGSGSVNCKTENCGNLPSYSTGATAPSGIDLGLNQQIPGYTGGFGAPSGILKPSDYANPTLSTNLNVHNLPSSSSSTPVACSSGHCNTKVTSPSAPSYSVASSGAYASASSAASANEAVYLGGFGGPPGLLKPHDNKVDLAKIAGGLHQGSHFGGGSIHPSHEAQPGTLSGAPLDTGAGGHLGTQSNIGALASSAAGATAYSASLANTGGYDSHGTHQAAHGVKGSSPCGGGCGSGYQGGLNGSSAAAVARSLSHAGAFGVGGNFASSSASAQSSSGAYTKGGYGKR